MKNIIYCFSGTGNSLAVAKVIADYLGDTEVVLIADAMKEESIGLPYERVGIVCPAYYGSLPPIVVRFVAKLNLSEDQYVFAVITAGGIHGMSLDTLTWLLSKRGGHLAAGAAIPMPGNYIAMYGAWPAWIRNFLLKRAKKKAANVAEIVKGKYYTKLGKKLRVHVPLDEKISGYAKFAQDYHVTDKCTGCEVCVKVCPARNIALEEGRPAFGENCERCMACIQWCPVKAIEYKNKTARRKQYRNPDVQASDLFPKTNYSGFHNHV